MRNSKLTIILVVLIAFSVIFLIGCSKPAPKVEDLKGKWVAIKKEAYKLGSGQQVGFVIEFFDDKTVMLPYGKGTWDILPDGRVKIEVPKVIMHGSMEGNILTITMPDDQGKVILKKQ